MVIILLANGFEEIEALTPLDLLRRAGVETYTVAICKEGKTVTGSHGITVTCDLEPDQVNTDKIELAIFPGGMPGATNLDSAPFTDVVIDAVTRNNGRLAAICAAPLVLGGRGLLEGKRATCYPGFEDKLKGAVITGESVVTDGNITTAKGMGVSLKFAEELVSLVAGEDKAKSISEGIMEESKPVCCATSCPSEKKTDFQDFILNVTDCGIDLTRSCGFGSCKREVVKLDRFDEGLKKREYLSLCVPIGINEKGEPFYDKIESTPHMLIGGATGSGKTQFINALLTTIVKNTSPEEIRLILIDPKCVEFRAYNSAPQMLCPVITSGKEAVNALNYALNEMESRYTLFERAGIRSIVDYNRTAENKLPRIVIAIDEISDLYLFSKSVVENAILRLTQKARAAGIHLIISAQDSSALPASITANIPTRAVFRTPSSTASIKLLGSRGADLLCGKGDMLYKGSAQDRPVRLQAPFVTEDEINSVVEEAARTYDTPKFNITKLIKNTEAQQNTTHEDEDEDKSDSIFSDETFIKVVEICLEDGKVSTSLLQRKLSIGYARAAKYIDILDCLGFISESDGIKPRTVLITEEQWNKILAENDG